MGEFIWSISGIMIGENWSTGRETLYSVGGSWMNGYGALVEWYWQGKTEVLGDKLSQWHFVHHKSHKDWPGIEPGLATNRMRRGTAFRSSKSDVQIQSVHHREHNPSPLQTPTSKWGLGNQSLSSVKSQETHIYTARGKRREFMLRQLAHIVTAVLWTDNKNYQQNSMRHPGRKCGCLCVGI